MGALNGLAYLIALVISAGEIARFWGSERFIPMAVDELLIAAALVWAAWRSRYDGACWHLAHGAPSALSRSFCSSKPLIIRCTDLRRRLGPFI